MPPCFKTSANGASRQLRMMQKYQGNTRDLQGTNIVTKGQQVMAAPNPKDCQTPANKSDGAQLADLARGTQERWLGITLATQQKCQLSVQPYTD